MQPVCSLHGGLLQTGWGVNQSDATPPLVQGPLTMHSNEDIRLSSCNDSRLQVGDCDLHPSQITWGRVAASGRSLSFCRDGCRPHHENPQEKHACGVPDGG